MLRQNWLLFLWNGGLFFFRSCVCASFASRVFGSPQRGSHGLVWQYYTRWVRCPEQTSEGAGCMHRRTGPTESRDRMVGYVRRWQVPGIEKGEFGCAGDMVTFRPLEDTESQPRQLLRPSSSVDAATPLASGDRAALSLLAGNCPSWSRQNRLGTFGPWWRMVATIIAAKRTEIYK